MEALRSPARNLIAPSAPEAGSGASLAKRMTLRLVRFSLPVVGPAGAVLGGGGAGAGGLLPNTWLRSVVPPKGLAVVAEGAVGAGEGTGLGAALAKRLGLGAGLAKRLGLG